MASATQRLKKRKEQIEHKISDAVEHVRELVSGDSSSDGVVPPADAIPAASSSVGTVAPTVVASTRGW